VFVIYAAITSALRFQAWITPLCALEKILGKMRPGNFSLLNWPRIHISNQISPLSIPPTPAHAEMAVDHAAHPD
jgi:hypothetical protein